MEQGHLILKAKATAGQRNALALLLAVSVASNAIMAVATLTKDRAVVLVPTVVSESMRVSRTSVSKEYLLAVARDIATTMLNTTPKSRQFVLDTLLPLAAPEFSGDLEKQIVQRWTEIDRKNLATVFFPQRFSADGETLTATVQGQLETYVSDTRTSSERKSYEIGFVLRDGRLHFTHFVELIKDEK